MRQLVASLPFLISAGLINLTSVLWPYIDRDLCHFANGEIACVAADSMAPKNVDTATAYLSTHLFLS